MKQNLITWLTLLLFAGSVFGQEPQPPQAPPPTAPPEIKQTPPSPAVLENQQPTPPPPPPPPVVEPPLVVVPTAPPPPPPQITVAVTPAPTPEELDYFSWDKMILSNEYQRNKFTYPYLAAVVRRTLSILGFKYAAVLVQPITIGHDGYVEPVLKNILRGFPAAWNAVISKKEDEFDGHFASITRVVFKEGFVINCVSTVTRRKVDPNLVWVRLTPCLPDFGTSEAWRKGAELDLEGFLDLDALSFERTPHVNIGPDSFKSRRPNR